MKAFLYIRVACADQLAAASQREALERYAKDKGYEVAAAAVSYTHLDVYKRQVLNKRQKDVRCKVKGSIRPLHCSLKTE